MHELHPAGAVVQARQPLSLGSPAPLLVPDPTPQFRAWAVVGHAHDVAHSRVAAGPAPSRPGAAAAGREPHADAGGRCLIGLLPSPDAGVSLSASGSLSSPGGGERGERFTNHDHPTGTGTREERSIHIAIARSLSCL
jgi:hypothetical protein